MLIPLLEMITSDKKARFFKFVSKNVKKYKIFVQNSVNFDEKYVFFYTKI